MEEWDARRFMDLWTPVVGWHIAHRNLTAYNAIGHTEDVIIRSAPEDHLYKKIKALADFLREHDLELSTDRADVILGKMTAGVHRSEVSQDIGDLNNRIRDELKRRTLLIIPFKRRELYTQPKPLFGDEVAKAFPSANDDIAEAGYCLAFERGTACVMHLSRAQEVALKALAATLRVGDQNDWGSYIRLINAELDKRSKASPKRSPDEEFYAASVAQFDNIKRAWRNPSMHPRGSYSPERAEEIFNAVRSFMRQLSTTISE